MGLVFDGGVHSHMEHLEALSRWQRMRGYENHIHCFMMGGMCPPPAAWAISELEKALARSARGNRHRGRRFWGHGRDKYLERRKRHGTHRQRAPALPLPAPRRPYQSYARARRMSLCSPRGAGGRKARATIGKDDSVISSISGPTGRASWPGLRGFLILPALPGSISPPAL